MGNLKINQVCECGSWYEEHPTETCQNFRFDPENTKEALAEWEDNKRELEAQKERRFVELSHEIAARTQQQQKDLIKEAVREVLDERLGMRG